LRLHLTDDFTAGGLAIKHLPEKALTGEAQRIDALTAVESLVGRGEQVNWDKVGQVPGELGEGGLAEFLHRAAAEGGEAGAEGGEDRCGHRGGMNTAPIDTSGRLAFNEN
jgi:hypothetical protein